MIDVKMLTKTFGKTIEDNAPTILSSIAVAGVVTTVFSAIRATPVAMRKISRQRELESVMQGEEAFLSKIEILKAGWQPYIPTMLFSAATIACIISANTLNNRRQAALISAYTLSDAAFKEYKTKVVETLGEDRETAVRDSIASDQVRNNPPNNELIIVGSGSVQCYDSLSGRYFQSDYETIRKVENDINSKTLMEDYTSLNDFYERLGLAPNAIGEELGWKTDNLLELRYSSVLAPNGVPTIVLDYTKQPIRNFWKGF